ncbi:hypothetical protein [Streptomyces capillispiralis]|uniref:Uncharacterized protein n=1 Tax=Streptomyces capillispiralis TaxID=68182 RepID=A0A561TPD3_9ACTN|nr:hypothetical protein FHX78_116005 [Streptomyces capillispiralis]GHH93233.1 hypothetical protein GCM10017779_36900 [Streptomyces capillispiralis]
MTAATAPALAQLGHHVTEMLGGFAYGVREGFAYGTPRGGERRAPAPLTAPVGSGDCGC